MTGKGNTLWFLPILFLAACSKLSGPAALFKKLPPHDAYGQRLKDVGLDHSALGGAWLQTAVNSLNNPLRVTIPYKETGYFPADKAQAASFQFEAKRGQKLHLILSRKPVLNFKIFIDLLQQSGNNQPKVVASADTLGLKLDYEISQAGKYLLRLQPELLAAGEYTLVITSGPSLSFPVSSSGNPHIGSFFGDSRDEGGRRHEGVDIFAPKGTPALSTGSGTVTSVTENKLGGLVVFVRPDDADYTLYYAHLGVQLVHNGQKVLTGDTVGLVGNTGNAKNTPSHLHFGIYTDNGAVDPFPFIDREIKKPHEFTIPLNLLNTSARTAANDKLYLSPDKKSTPVANLPIHTALTVNAATGDWYKVVLPNGQAGYVSGNNISKMNTIRMLTLKTAQPLFNSPDSAVAARKTVLATGEKVSIMAAYKNYYLVEFNGETGWIIH